MPDKWAVRLAMVATLVSLVGSAACPMYEHTSLPSTTTLERYPSLQVPEAVRPEGEFEVRASLEIEPPTAVQTGRLLWQRVAPRQFKRVYWDLVDQLGEDFDSIQIYADDPSIPWELMRPFREGSPERDFLGLEHELARGFAAPEDAGFGQMPATVRLEELLVMQPRIS